MASVMSLMQGPQQGPMPGQAPPQQMPGMLPQQGAPTPGAMTGSLKSMPLDQLKMMYMNPQPNSPPLWAVISALAEKQKEAQAMQMAQGQQAMAQNAQMQQQPPVAAQVMQSAEQMGEPVMAAYGGEMQGYAGGGAVAFQTAGAVPPGLMNPDVDEDGLPRGKDERERVIDYNNKIRAAYEQQMKSKAATAPRTAAPSIQDIAERMSGRRQLEQFYKPRDPEAYTPERVGFQVGDITASSAPTRQGKSGIADLDIGPSMAPLQRTAATSAAQQLGSGQSQQRQQAAPAPVQPTVANPATAASPADLSPEMAKALADREAQMRGRLVRPESLVAAEQGLAALAKSNIEAQQAEAKTYGEEIRAARDAAMARSQRDILSDPMSLLALAGSIDTRRGQGIGSLARGAAGLMGQREAAAEAARKEFTQAQRDERSMQANIRQTQMLEAQRQVALEQGKLGEVNAINDKLSELAMKREEFRIARGDKAFEQQRQSDQLNIEREKITSSERIADLNRKAQAALRNLPGPEQQMIERAINSVMAANPGMPYHEAYDKVRGAGKGQQEKNDLARQKLLESDMTYFGLRNTYLNTTDPAKKAEALRKMKDIERLKGIVDESASAPAGGGTVDRNNPLLK